MTGRGLIRASAVPEVSEPTRRPLARRAGRLAVPLIVLGIIALLAAGLTAAYRMTYTDRVYQGVFDAQGPLRSDKGGLRVVGEGKQGYRSETMAITHPVKLVAATDYRIVETPVRVTYPSALSEDQRAIDEPVSSATTTYSGDLPERRFNVELAASKLDGVVIGPGEIFSFNDELGPMTLQAGFRWGWGVSRTPAGELITVPSVAGGICQVSTTLFQTLFWAGYQIEERSGHLYWIDRYGQPPAGLKGLDSTVEQVYDRNGKLVYAADLKFKNTTPHPILIEAKTDGNRLTFNLYGRKPDWRISVDAPRIEGVVKADQAVVRELDPTLEPGEEVWTEEAQPGFRSTIVRTVTEQGKAPRELRLVSTYGPSRNVVRVGPPKADAEATNPASPTPRRAVNGRLVYKGLVE